MNCHDLCTKRKTHQKGQRFFSLSLIRRLSLLCVIFCLSMPSQIRSQEAPIVYFAQKNEPIKNHIALTFDDGPDPRYTPHLLDILKEAGVHATFFVIGSNAQEHPDLIKRMVSEGHTVGNHTFSHPNISRLSYDQLINEMEATDNIIFQLTGQKPLFMRPPFGLLPPSHVAMLQSVNKKVILWSVDTEDWRGIPAGDILHKVRDGIRPGAIVLMHDGGSRKQDLSQTPVAVKKLIDEYSSSFEFITVDQLLSLPAYRK
ncbi:polysaccharide deacetylase family protein [Aureibacillus halotolerans]|uniref:Peptidoglycan/xylan/chitin deacetylase (PgdA/CDA1 family) n=1 Tax=Aureibacillus halotolerans TaxID=1508390 RepID=A0A4R6TPX6_9BACI|nr:polysaccharide deacetylase family protein [Aureibacillus halotolerans]TDQ34231.1 peptidoglycan/xylan/chitin deacetylase (PgdA/CDA1 family) [Aureibacillus halotolerans]